MQNPKAVSLSDRLTRMAETVKSIYPPAPKQEPQPTIPPQPRAPRHATLVSLPLKIRQQVYSALIPRHRIVSVSNKRFDSAAGWPFTNESDEAGWTRRFQQRHPRHRTNIFRVSKQISSESLDFLYGENCFALYLTGASTALQNFSARNRRRIRFLLLVSRGRSRAGSGLDMQLWGDMLPGLRVLRMVIAQPYRTIWGAEIAGANVRREMERWGHWMGGILGCFGEVLRGGTVRVEVDCDGQMFTLDMVERCLPKGWEEVRCRYEGDVIFHRGKFAWWGREFFDVTGG